MNKYLSKNVIVPFDFSDMSISAIRESLEMVDKPEQLIVVHVTPYPSATDPAVIWGNNTEETIASNIRKSFDQSCGDNGIPTGLKFVTGFGDPGANIVKIASENNASLIVIPSHGRSGLSRIFLGSVAERVVRLAECPVLVLRNQNEDKR